MMKKRKSKQLIPVFVFALLMFAAGCWNSGQPWETKDISGLMPDLAFQLIESNRDRPVSARDYRGKVLLMYFGYTQCPDVCSTTMLRLYNTVSTLGADGKQLRILFVSVDPRRDSLAVLKRYTHAYGEEVVGLRGGQEALRQLTKRYRVTYGYDKPDKNGNYKVSHSSAVYVFDRRGRARLLLRATDPVNAISHDLRRLIAESGPGRQD
jgi:protein SCO1/2